MSTTTAPYLTALPLLEAARADVLRRVQAALAGLDQPTLARARNIHGRIKEPTSLERKARTHGWTIPQALELAPDLVGLRVVCFNLRDARKVADAIEAALKADSIPVSRQDYSKEPKESGYRAIHLNIRFTVALGPLTRLVGCEVQIRTLLQDAWGQLTREDIYTVESKYSSSLLKRFKRLAEQLQVADDIADDIREDMVAANPGEKAPAGAPPSPDTVAFMIAAVLGSPPPDYVAQTAFEAIQESNATTEAFERALRQEHQSGKLKNAYMEVFNLEPDLSQILRWVATSAAAGDEAALLQAQKAARDDLQEIQEQGRREELGSLPKSWQDVIDTSKDGDSASDVYWLARLLGGYSRCLVCDEMVISSEDLAEAIVEHYGLEDEEAESARSELMVTIENSGAEVGTWASDGLCSYHHHMSGKDE